jgi:hypothetical protein
MAQGLALAMRVTLGGEEPRPPGPESASLENRGWPGAPRPVGGGHSRVVPEPRELVGAAERVGDTRWGK